MGSAAIPLEGAAVRYSGLLFVLSAGFLAYANYLSLVRRHGGRRTRLAVGVMTAGTLLAWLYNFFHH